MRRLLSTSLLISSIVLAPPTAGAQSPGESQRWPSVSIDATIGGSNGHPRGEYMDNRSGMSADVLLAVGFGRVAGGRMVGGLDGSVYGAAGRIVACAPSCVRPFPSFTLLGAVVGWESGRSRLRVSAGPAAACAYRLGDAPSLAWLGRLDGALPIARHVAAVASGRGALVPEYRGDPVRLLALGVGLRIH
jgi:hypothetical protein